MEPQTTTDWSPTVGVRILITKDGKRKLQQRWTRLIYFKDGTNRIEERWEDVPTHNEE